MDALLGSKDIDSAPRRERRQLPSVRYCGSSASAWSWRSQSPWDYFHFPAETRHVIVGAGDGPCAILMIGARPDEPIRYPVSEVAAKHAASVAKETGLPDEAYADWPGEYQPVRL